MPVRFHRTRSIYRTYIRTYVHASIFFITTCNKLEKINIGCEIESLRRGSYVCIPDIYGICKSLARLGLKNCTPVFETIYLELESDLGSKTVKSVRAG